MGAGAKRTDPAHSCVSICISWKSSQILIHIFIMRRALVHRGDFDLFPAFVRPWDDDDLRPFFTFPSVVAVCWVLGCSFVFDGDRLLIDGKEVERARVVLETGEHKWAYEVAPDLCWDLFWMWARV